MFGPERIVLISDSMRATGLPDGHYELGDQPVDVHGNLATLHDGTIAASVTNLMDCMKKAVSMGIPLETAVRSASYNPACFPMAILPTASEVLPSESRQTVFFLIVIHWTSGLSSNPAGLFRQLIPCKFILTFQNGYTGSMLLHRSGSVIGSASYPQSPSSLLPCDTPFRSMGTFSGAPHQSCRHNCGNLPM